jgi:hypothetical protein
MRRATISALMMATALFAQTETAHACACCTEPGQRMETTGPMDTYVRGELALMRFGSSAMLYSGPGFPDDITGIVNPSASPYRVRAAIRGVVRFDFVDPAGRPGRVQFLLPRTMSRFEVDPRTNAGPTPPNGPNLYKEWRLSGTAQLSGIAAGAGNAAGATLILHGDGNSCSAAPNFARWTLAVKGRGIAFTFLGDLAP